MAEDTVDTKVVDDDFEIIEVDNDGKPIEQQLADDKKAADEKKAANDSKKGEDAEDDRLAAEDELDTELKERRERRRLERKQRRANTRAALERGRRYEQENAELKTTVMSLQEQLQHLAAQQSGMGLSILDQQIQDTSARIQQMKRVMFEANKSNNTDDAMEAENIRDQLNERLQALKTMRERQAQQAEAIRAPRQTKQQGPDPVMVGLAREFMADNPWYDPNSTDQDSVIATAIDAALTREGKDPTKQEYWDELEDRLAEALPHRYNSGSSNGNGGGSNGSNGSTGSATTQQRRGPPMGGGRDQGSVNGKRQVYISPERKQAMIDAGIWDDVKKRNEMIREYVKYDAANPVTKN